MSIFASGCLPNGVAQAQLATWEDGFGLIELVAKRRDGSRAVRRTLRRQGNTQFCFIDLYISGAGQSGLDEGSSFLARPPVMRRH